MGWFWADTTGPATPSSARPYAQPPESQPPIADSSTAPPAGCPMHKRTIEALSPSAFASSSSSPSHEAASSASASGCPVGHESAAAPPGCPVNHDSQLGTQAPPRQQSTLSRLNPLNYMFSDLSQAPAPNQSASLPTTRDESTIPKGSGDGNWEYPSPQQMYNALLRKGYTDTDATAVESMVAVHNFLNEGAWAEITEWERRFGKGLARGWEVSKRGEENAEMRLRLLEAKEGSSWGGPTLVRFQGRPKDMTPRAAMLQVMGWLYPAKFATEPPFDRHDWYVSRNINGKEKQVRYVIDYYSGEPEPTGEPVFYLDVRPALSPTGAVERLMRWGGDVWWRASGGEVRETGPGK